MEFSTTGRRLRWGAMSATSDAYWLALRRVHGAGPRTCRLLLERFGSAERIFKAGEQEIVAAGAGRNVARAIAAFNDFAPLERNCANYRGSAPTWCAGPMPTTR